MSTERRGGRPAPADPPRQVAFRVPSSKASKVEAIVAAWGAKTREAAGVDLPASALSANAWFGSIIDREAVAYGVESTAPVEAPPKAKPKRSR
jgi:hypothetical protein